MVDSFLYFDNNATTMLDPQVLLEITPYLKTLYGNPNSPHHMGLNTHEGISKASEQLYNALNINEDDTLIITSSATESINTVHKSILFDFLKNKGGKNQIITSTLEHSAVQNSLQYLEDFGIQIITLPTVKHCSTVENFQEYFDPEKTLLVSIAYVNSETGIIQPISEIAQLCRQQNVLIHTDATQAIGKIPVDIQSLGVDYLSFSGHKFHAPKGVGALYIKNSAPLTPLLHGGEQMGGFRAGTLNVAGIVGMGKALEIAVQNMDTNSLHLLKLRNKLENFLTSINDCFIYGLEQERIPNTTFFNIPRVNADYLAWYLNNNNIFVATSTACTSGKIDEKSNLGETSLGVRVSFSRFNTEDQINTLISHIKDILKNLPH